MKVLQVIDSLRGGGAESLLATIVDELTTKDNVKVDVVTLFDNGIFADRINKSGANLWCFKIKGLAGIFIGVYKLVKLLKIHNYDVVHVHLFPANIIVAISSLFYKKCKYIYTEHNEWNRRRKYKWFNPFEKFTYSRFSTIICVSKRVRDVLSTWIPGIEKKSIIMLNIVTVPEKQWFIDGGHNWDLLLVGSFREAKGIDLFLKIFSRLRERGNNIISAIAGDGPLRGKLEQLAEELNIKENVKFLGYRSDINTIMLSSRVLIITSRWEGLPIVLLEAMSLGVPVVATKVGGIPEIIQNNINGILISDIQDIESSASSIEKLLINRDQMERLGSQARNTIIKHYSVKQYTNTLLNLYSKT